MGLWLSAEAAFAVYSGARGAASPDTHKERLGADLLQYLNATNERAADESCDVHA